MKIKNITKFMGIAIFAFMMTLGINGCKKTDDPDDGDDNKNPTVTQDYIKFNGEYCYMKNPKKGDLRDKVGDISLYWAGNQPSGVEGDTTLKIRHGDKDDIPRTEGLYPKIVVVPINKGEVGIILKWGTTDGNPSVVIKSGDYTLSREGGFWVSTLKNGTGVWEKTGGDKTYTGIEFRITWPD